MACSALFPCRGSSAFRRWWETTGGGGPRYQGAGAVAEPLRHPVSGLPDRVTILNRHAQHTSHCSACQAVSCCLLYSQSGSKAQSGGGVLLTAFPAVCTWQQLHCACVSAREGDLSHCTPQRLVRGELVLNGWQADSQSCAAMGCNIQHTAHCSVAF